MTENKIKPAPYVLPFKHQNSNFWDKKTSSIDVSSYNKFLLDTIRTQEKKTKTLEINKAEIAARQKEKTDRYWKERYETKYTSAYQPYSNDDTTLTDKDEVYLRSIGFDV